MEESRGSSAVSGAGWGVVLWSAYAIVEYFLYSVIPLFRVEEGVFTLFHWRLSSLLFDCYWLLGALAGAAVGAIVFGWARRKAGRRRGLQTGRLEGSLGLLAAVQINLCFAFPLGHFADLVFVVAAVLTAAILWVLRYPDTVLADWVDFHPCLLAFLLICPVWISTEALDIYRPKTKLIVVLLCLAATTVFNWLLRRVPRWTAGVHFLSGLAILLLLVLASGIKSGEHKVTGTPNVPRTENPGRAPVVMVSFDTTRADHTSVNGYSRKTTPYLAEFAAGATVFSNAMATSDMTLASHASIFTGVYPSWHGARFSNGQVQPLDDKLPTLAGVLAGHGYFTAAMVANSAYLTPVWGLNRGFGFFDVQSAVELLASGRRFELRQGIRALLGWNMPTSDFDLLFRRAEEINDVVFRIMDRKSVRERSFFLFVNYMDAHAPYSPPAPFDSAFLQNQPQVSFAQWRLLQKDNTSTADERRRITAQYDGGIAYEDFAFHHLVRWLKSRNLYDNALIIVTGDHGEALGERGRLGHGFSVHGDEVNVPLLVKYPRQTTGSVVDLPASQVDILPTVLDALGYDIPSHVQGRSLRRLDDLQDRQLLAECVSARALRSGPMKLIVNTAGSRELYDLSQDRAEMHDLYAAGGPNVASMDAALQQWMQRVPSHSSKAPLTVDPRELRRLKTLGYLH